VIDFVNFVLFHVHQRLINDRKSSQLVILLVKCQTFQLILTVAEKSTHISVEHLGPNDLILENSAVYLVNFHEEIVAIRPRC
jgi:hypothetical protein